MDPPTPVVSARELARLSAEREELLAHLAKARAALEACERILLKGHRRRPLTQSKTSFSLLMCQCASRGTLE